MTAGVVVDAQAHVWSLISDTLLPGLVVQVVSKLPVEVLNLSMQDAGVSSAVPVQPIHAGQITPSLVPRSCPTPNGLPAHGLDPSRELVPNLRLAVINEVLGLNAECHFWRHRAWDSCHHRKRPLVSCCRYRI